ncbi:mandelate racemase/muconate lactonizing enzyme family protein [Natronorubrum daqingense]|uniref:o-succinylbenzoate synthase n=1 Tax=Natronorubrum daqingense TaxID=588898 RepID=A0A1N6XDQ2_9EURY|nr:o-succinylbenzoate synthase [Natronorubrum daqingense]APX95977.1 o-succinylbenzoate synthase [Natronorubrum daqingense]SIR00482.1 o-succinylbenzoate synthase [Natronorubrum daqingense]
MSGSCTDDRDRNRELELEYRSFSLPLAAPLETGDGTIESRDGFLVRIVDANHEGNPAPVGYGEATPLAGWTESLEDCRDALERAESAVQVDPETALETVSDQVAARHAITLALADLQATSRSTPLYQYLGNGPLVGRVPVNATVGSGSPAETAQEARAAVERGFKSCKLKVGQRSLETDLERIARTREAVGPDVELRVDANGAWTVAEATRALETLAEYDVSLLEQPLPAGSLDGHADLRRSVGEDGVAIGLDEGLLEHGVDAICDAGAADTVILKPMALGGIDVVRKIAAWVRMLDIEPIVTTTIDGVVARTGALHVAASIPDVPACGLATADLLADDLGNDPVLLENGSAVVPQAKGLGVEGVWDA